MPRKTRAVSTVELTNAVTAALRRAAIRPSIIGYRPMDHQLEFHKSMSQGRLFIGGNRSGKTVSGAAESCMWLTGQHKFRATPPPPVRGRGIATDFDHGFELVMKPEIARWLPPSALINGSWEESFNKQLKLLTLANGSTMEFLSTDQELDKHAGTSRHFFWCDEEPPKAHFSENKMRLIDTGGSWWITMTPVEGMTWVYDDIYLPGIQGTDPGLSIVTASIDDNIYINTNEIDALMSGLDEEEKDARRHGKFIQMGGLIYKMFNPQKHIIPQVYGNPKYWPQIRKKWHHFCMMDHGFNNPTCWLWGATDNDRIIIYYEYYDAGHIVSHHAENVKEINRLLGIEPEYNVGDPSIRNTDPITATSVLLEYMDFNVPIMEGNNDVKAGINRVARMFEENRLFVAENCEKLTWELQRYRWAKFASKKTEQTRNAQDTPMKKNDHACDALRYGIASRPFFDSEVDRKMTNVLNAPVAIDPTKPRIDEELSRMAISLMAQSYEQRGYVDPILGGEY